MSLRLSLQNLATRITNNFVRLKQKYPVQKTSCLKDSTKMEPTRKKQKMVLEECELIIEINKKGECSFDVMSKVETVCNGKTLDVSASSESGDCCDDSYEAKTASPGDKVNGNATMTDVNGDLEDKDEDDTDDDKRFPPTSKYVALDCEFVGVLGDISALGRCSIVNYDEEVICDIYAQPVEKITRYRTKYSGITKAHMKHAIPLECALSQISDIIKDKIVVGHDVDNDFRVLGFGHPEHMVRDTRKCKLLQDKLKQENNSGVSLKNMVKVLLGKEIQKGSHCSVIDATTTMQLYKLVREEWETRLLINDKNRSKLPDDQDQPPDNKDVSMDTEPKSDIPNAAGSELKNGKSTGKQNMSKKGKSFRPRFGQILGGSINVNDYFKNDTNIFKNSVKGFTKCLNRQSLESDSKSNSNLDQKNGVSFSKSCTENGNFHMLRDGTRYQSLNPCQDKGVGPATLRKRKCKFDDSEKVNLKTVYDKSIKQLFHDDFWNDMTMSADADKVGDEVLT